MSKAETIQAQQPKAGEPSAVGYPCIATTRDVNAAKASQVGQGAAGTPPQPSLLTRVLAGSGLTYYNGLYYWYSNANSSDFCDKSYVWHSGYVTAYQFLGVCGVTGLNSYNIWVSDL